MEIEVKYQTDQAQARQLFCHPLLAPYLGPAHQIPMQAVYYDTAQGECAAAGFVLRLRREGETAICTAKGGRVVSVQQYYLDNPPQMQATEHQKRRRGWKLPELFRRHR